MSVPFEEQRSVWTDNDDPKWTAQNCGLPDMLLTGRLDDHHARYLCERLLILRPDLTFYIKDIHNRVLDTFALRPAIQSHTDDRPDPRRTRRTLGNRGA